MWAEKGRWELRLAQLLVGEVASRIVVQQSRLGDSKWNLGLIGRTVVMGELWRESERGGCWGWDVVEVTKSLGSKGKRIEAVDVVELVEPAGSEALGSA